MNPSERQALLEEEWLLVRHSGEIPEVALHSSLHYLCNDADGPQMQLSLQEMRALEAGVIARYQEIILRDLNVENRNLPLFRGIRRARHNWYRFVRFSETIGLSVAEFRDQSAAALLRYLQITGEEGMGNNDTPAVNCLAETLLSFVIALGLDEAQLPENWPCLCEQHGDNQ